MNHDREPDRPAGRGVLEGAFLLLDVLARVDESGPSRLAAASGLPKPTVHRLLQQLVAVGAVQRRAGRYRIGPRLFSLGQAWNPAPTAAQRPVRALAFAPFASRFPQSPNAQPPWPARNLPATPGTVPAGRRSNAEVMSR
ncbi:IclR-like helix-turn-helix domain-containing protein [Nocardia tenerifensis]|uniref:IclR-like helix-turn-helix domain-containing protein n=1 Tax=Nocardia tenerifensis TaxID=228006 RepID=A0A318K7J7_9NOCA|nr:helix-turn-helix domain-containing protein [Nocardia tenerifensis]PXX68654.1 IclR-like helix-turn-helix domain-containing protein [Nocardia tenerifensis]